MLGSFLRFYSLLKLQLRAAIGGSGLAVLGVLLLLPARPVRADIYDITLINVTFTATCIGGGTCTEVYNGEGLYDLVNNTATGITSTLTGTLSGSLNAYGTPTCTAPGCISGALLYDVNHLPGTNPIELEVVISNYNAPTPQALLGGPTGATFFVPAGCGGDQPLCNHTGAFPGGPSADYLLTSGSYTSFDVGPSPTPEPEPALLVLSGTALGALYRRFR